MVVMTEDRYQGVTNTADITTRDMDIVTLPVNNNSMSMERDHLGYSGFH